MNSYNKIKQFRNRITKSNRTMIWAIAQFSCDRCLLSIPFQVGIGVGNRAEDMPWADLDCPACGETKGLKFESVEPCGIVAANPNGWIMRVPSRRAAIIIAGLDEVRPQVVRPPDAVF